MVNNTDIHGFKAVAVALILIITGPENWINGVFLTCSRPQRGLKHSSPSSLSPQPSWLWCLWSRTLLQLLLAPVSSVRSFSFASYSVSMLSAFGVLGYRRVLKSASFETFKMTFLILSYVWAEVIFVNIFLSYSCFWIILCKFFVREASSEIESESLSLCEAETQTT